MYRLLVRKAGEMRASLDILVFCAAAGENLDIAGSPAGSGLIPAVLPHSAIHMMKDRI
jgi:hypothetical protein